MGAPSASSSRRLVAVVSFMAAAAAAPGAVAFLQTHIPVTAASVDGVGKVGWDSYPATPFLPIVAASADIYRRNDAPLPALSARGPKPCYDEDGDYEDDDGDGGTLSILTEDPSRSVAFSTIMAVACGALLGPLLDSYRVWSGLTAWETNCDSHPFQATASLAWWIPEFYGLVGVLVGWCYILLDDVLDTDDQKRKPSPSNIWTGLAFFALQCWLGGVLFKSGWDRTTMFGVMNFLAGFGYSSADFTATSLVAGLAAAVFGPLAEVGLMTALSGQGSGYYHYTDLGETLSFPLWITPIYFLGSVAVGNAARGIWHSASLTEGSSDTIMEDFWRNTQPRCEVCQDTRVVECSKCNSLGYHVTDGNQVECSECGGRGLVICLDCCNSYGDDPGDTERIREIMSRVPD